MIRRIFVFIEIYIFFLNADCSNWWIYINHVSMSFRIRVTRRMVTMQLDLRKFIGALCSVFFFFFTNAIMLSYVVQDIDLICRFMVTLCVVFY